MKIINQIKNNTALIYRRSKDFVVNRPLLSFVVLLAVIFALIAGGSFLNNPAEESEEAAPRAKAVSVFSIGLAPKISVPAQVEKSGVIRIVAQNGGVVQEVSVREGQTVQKGERIVSISTNYSGGTAETVQREINAVNYVYQRESFDKEIELINLRREQAKENFENSEKLREVAEESEERTEDQIDLNSDLLDEVEDRIELLEATNVGGANDTEIFQLKQTQLQLTASNNQLKSSLESSEVQTGSRQEGIDELTRDITLAQLDLEERSKKLALETSRLNLQLSKILEARMFPSAPISGVVERVFVETGQVVNPGDTLAIVTGADNNATAVALISTNIANRISIIEESILIKNAGLLNLYPSYISTEPTDGNLHSVIYNIPEEDAARFVSGEFITIQIPIGSADSISTAPFIPVESVYQTQDSSYVYVAEQDAESGDLLARIKEIELGRVYGSFVEVESGLEDNDQIILNRNIVENEAIELIEE